MSQKAPTLIKTDAVLDVPESICVCPYCKSPLFVRFSCWTQCDDGSWITEWIELECTATPELDDDDDRSLIAWREFWHGHSYMPYVKWLPATLTVENWVNANYRFDMDD